MMSKMLAFFLKDGSILWGPAGKSAPPCGKALNGKDGRDSTLADSRPGTDGQDGKAGKLIVPQIPQHFQMVTELNPENR